MPTEDTRWMLELLNYGALGVFALFCMVTAWKLGHALWDLLFSRNPEQLGVAIKISDSVIKRNEKMSLFMDALSDREVKQQELCEKHNTELVQIRGDLTGHDARAAVGLQDVAMLKGLARQACQLARTLAKNEWPNSIQEVDAICTSMESRIDNV